MPRRAVWEVMAPHPPHLLSIITLLASKTFPCSYIRYLMVVCIIHFDLLLDNRTLRDIDTSSLPDLASTFVFSSSVDVSILVLMPNLLSMGNTPQSRPFGCLSRILSINHHLPFIHLLCYYMNKQYVMWGCQSYTIWLHRMWSTTQRGCYSAN